MTEGEKRLRAHVWVAGRVHGVAFRAFTINEASARHIAGWVRNTEDGRVEAVFEGGRSAVEAIVAWCRKGPPAARVTSMHVIWEEPTGETGFRVRYSRP